MPNFFSARFDQAVIGLVLASHSAAGNSQVISDQGTTLAAQNNITIEAATNTTSEHSFRDSKTSGVFSSGGAGFTVGKQQKSLDQQGATQTAAASTVGSTQGNVTIQAGKTYIQTGSDVLAPKGDITIAAQKVDIVEAREINKSQTESKFKQSGLTVVVTSPVINAIQTTQQMGKAASDTSDSRMKALTAANIGFSGKTAIDAIKTGQGSSIGGKDGQMLTGATNQDGSFKTNPDGSRESRDATTAEKMGGINLSVSLGSSKSQSNTVQTSDSARGSTVSAGNNLTISASGAGHDSDIIIQGSNLQAANLVALSAQDEIKLLAAQNTSSQNSTNSSKSASAGISVGTAGFGVTLAASKGRGNADGKDLTWTNTNVQGGQQVAMLSGGDTTLKGAVIIAPQVQAQVGGNLQIESLQDTSSYASKQNNLGGSLTIGSSVNGSINASKSKSNSDYASVNEQSGLKAGDQGFSVNVSHNTALIGWHSPKSVDK